MTWTGFGSINLAGVASDTEGMSLKPGAHVCKVTKVEIKDSKNGGGKVLHVDLAEVEGRGTIRDFINIYHPKQDVREIGMRRLANFLRSSNHPSPDNPGDVKSLVGLIVGVYVDPEPFTAKDGSTKNGSKVRDRGAYFNPNKDGQPVGYMPESAGGGRAREMDEIPF